MRSRAWVVFALVAAGGSSAYAQPPSEAWHFTTDTTRRARVDDRGGLGEGYSFSIEYDPTDGNSEDFCPHCRLSLLVSDPGLDMNALQTLGVHAEDLGTATGALTTLQGLAARDPTGLAMELQPGLSGDDLAAFVATITEIQAQIVTVIGRLEMLATLATPSFDWATADIDALVTALSLHMDTAFRGDFSDPNDPRIHNSGVAVYGLPDFIAGLAGQGVPSDVQASIQSSLSSIPGLSGSLEISGDDDNVMEPASYHGYHTDLTVRERTYVVNGYSAYLIVYTIANDTPRVFPLVQAAMITDFDIPPGGWDTQTSWDPALQMIGDEDVVDWVMPEQHYWFGVAPAGAGAPTPGSFAFANYNIDMNFTLAQYGSDVTQQNRYRFFLGDPSIVGDHDTATARSEKQGGVSMTLQGPLLPGQQRSVAFCYAAGEGGSASAAQTELTAIMTACRALYTALTPNCGDGVLQYGEECEGGAAAGCSADCHRLVCGDGRVDSPEECDDGNTTDGDGCSASCVREVCGNGIVQAGEECDDGNASNTDSCTTECRNASCGDGYLRACSGSGCGGCAGHAYCFNGTFTLDTYSLATGSHFASMNGRPIDYLIAWDTVAVDSTTLAATRGIRVTTGPIHIEMAGDSTAASIARSYEGQSVTIDINAAPIRGISAFSMSRLLTPPAGRGVRVGFDIYAASAANARFSVDRTGFPILTTVRLTNATARMQVVPTIGLPTDTATGALNGSIGVPSGGSGEACDDGNNSDFDDCTNACRPAACGDGFVQVSAGEECDEGLSPPAWCVGCHRAMIDLCGNGTIETAIGETCDDGNRIDGDGCSGLCQPESCGDGIVQGAEECDDGANGNNDGCTDACTIERCGDGVMQSSEECDAGGANADTAACTSTCHNAICGDGLVQAGVEECDDGNTADVDGCSAACTTERCGDGRPGPMEQCDDGNMVDGDGCSTACRMEVCGDGVAGPMEQCDDGNVVDGDGCSKDCLLENLAACGDGSVGTGEQCDDGGNTSGDGCDEFCRLENLAACGNGTVDPGEGCDDGNTMAGDGCNALCGVERCGDSVHAAGEGCDDGNNRSGDGCSATCEIEPSACGNGRQEYGEQCDDGNTMDGDSCTATCLIDPPGSAPLAMTCGNGMQDLGEQCDDGGRMDGNGCGATCQLEESVCGNARLEYGETCDDGNTDNGDGCSDACAFEGPTGPVLTPGGCGCNVPRGSNGAAWIALALIGLAIVRRRRAQ